MPRHPIHELLAEAAYAGRELIDEELAALKLGADDREKVARAAREAAELHRAGDRGRGRELALRRSHEIVAELPEEQRDPLYAREPENLDGLGPEELAARVPRPY